MATLEKLKPGDILYDVHSERAGNTTMRRQGEWRVHVKEVHLEAGYALCSWNGNTPSKYRRGDLARLRVKPAAKLNGHVRACRLSSGVWSMRDECTCPKAE